MNNKNINSFQKLEKKYMAEYTESSDKVEKKINKSVFQMEVLSNITEVFLPKLFDTAVYVFESSTKNLNNKKTK